MTKQRKKKNPLTLKTLAFKMNYKALWENSDLPAQTLEYAMKSFDEEEDGITQEYYDEFLKKNSEALDKIENHLEENAPHQLKSKLLAAVAGYDYNMRSFAIEIGRGVNETNEENVKYCMDNVVCFESGQVNMTQTVLDVMEKSKFSVMFDDHFLLSYCLTYNTLKSLYGKVKKSLKIVKGKKEKLPKKVIDQIEDLLSGFEGWDPSQHWFKDQRMCRHNDPDPAHLKASEMQHVAVSSSDYVDPLNYYFNLAKKESKRYSQNELMLTAKYMFKNNVYTPNKIMFMCENLDKKIWEEILQQYFFDIFLCLLSCWSYRDKCSGIYKMALTNNLIDKHTFEKIMWGISNLCYGFKFQYFDIATVAKYVWTETPNDFKENSVLQECLIPKIVLLRGDFATLLHFIEKYDDETKKNVITHVIYNCYFTSRENRIPELLEAIKPLNVSIGNAKQLMSEESFKRYLLNDLTITKKPFENLDIILEIVSGTNGTKFKEELLGDKHFMISFITDVYDEKCFANFLKWLLEDAKSIEKYKEKLLHEKWIHEAYEQILIENLGCDRDDSGLKVLGLSEPQEKEVKNEVQENFGLVSIIFSHYLESRELTHSYHYHWIFTNDDSRRQFMEYYITTEDCYEAIIHDMINIDTLETDESLRIPGCLIMLNYLELIKKWLKPNKLVKKFKKIFTNRSKSLPNEALRVKGKIVSGAQLKQAKVFSNAIYKGFIGLLEADFEDTDIKPWDRDPLSLLPLSDFICRKSGLTVPNIFR